MLVQPHEDFFARKLPGLLYYNTPDKMNNQLCHVKPDFSLFLYKPNNFIHRQLAEKAPNFEPKDTCFCVSSKVENPMYIDQEIQCAISFKSEDDSIQITQIYTNHNLKNSLNNSLALKLLVQFFWFQMVDHIRDHEQPHTVKINNHESFTVESYVKRKYDSIKLQKSLNTATFFEITDSIFSHSEDSPRNFIIEAKSDGVDVNVKKYVVAIYNKTALLHHLCNDTANTIIDISHNGRKNVIAFDGVFCKIDSKDNFVEQIKAKLHNDSYRSIYGSGYGEDAFIIHIGPVNKSFDHFKNLQNIDLFSILDISDNTMSISLSDPYKNVVGVCLFEIINHTVPIDSGSVDNGVIVRELTTNRQYETRESRKINFSTISNFKKWIRLVSLNVNTDLVTDRDQQNRIKTVLITEFMRIAVALKNYFFENITHIGYVINKKENNDIDSSLIDMLIKINPNCFINMKAEKKITQLRNEYEKLEEDLIKMYKNLLDFFGKRNEEFKSLHNYTAVSEAIRKITDSKDHDLNSDIPLRTALEQYCSIQSNLEKEAALNVQDSFRGTGRIEKLVYDYNLVVDKRDEMIHIKQKIQDQLFNFPKILHVDEILHIENNNKTGFIWLLNVNDRIDIKGLEIGLKRTLSLDLTYRKRRNENFEDKNSKRQKFDSEDNGGIREKLNCVMCFDTKPKHCGCHKQEIN